MRTWFFPPKTALALLLVIGFALPAADSAAWWNKQWRLRTTVARSVPELISEATFLTRTPPG